MKHRVIEGRLEYTSRKPDMMGKVRGFETFMFTRHSDGKVTLQAAYLQPDVNKFGPGPYPTIVPVYGGPHVQTVSNSWTVTADLRSQFLCSQGYLIVKIDNRGSSRRGLIFESQVKPF